MKNKFIASLFAVLLSFIVSVAPTNADRRINLNMSHIKNIHKTSASGSGNSIAATRPISITKSVNIGKSSNFKAAGRGKDSDNLSKPAVSLPKGISKNWWQEVQRSIAKAEYKPGKNKYGLLASNRAHNLRTFFEPTGIQLYDRMAKGNPRLAGLSLSKIGHGENLKSVAAGTVKQSDLRVEIRRSGITEWYENTPQGLEQGFTLPERSKGQGSLVLELTVQHAHASLHGQSIELTTESGRQLNYQKLIVQDAQGKVLPSHMEVPSAQYIRLVVEDIDAVYPLVIDPLLTGVADSRLESNHVWSGSFDSAMFGYSVSGAGDVNGDGFKDIVVGAHGWDAPGGLFDEGAAFVFLGGPNGIVGTDPTTANAVLLGDRAGTEFGFSVSGAGDVNGDGFDDIIVGAHLYDSTIAGSTLEVRGAAFVFLGGPNGIVGNGPATAHASIYGNELDSRLGHVVSRAGDVDGDGFDDIIIGAPLEGVPFPPNIAPNQRSGNGGAALIFLGSAAGITGTGFDDADSLILPYPPGQPVASLQQLGADVSTADVNGDGFDDVLVGAAGYVLVFHGSAAGIVGTDPSTANAKIVSDAFVNVGALIASAGDVNGDGFDDILLSDTGYPTGVSSGGHGAFMVFLGSASGITATSPADADTFIEGDLPIVILGPVQNLGWRLSSAGDVDGDGFGDIIIGALEFPGSLDLEGSAYVFRGSATGIVGSSLADAYIHLKTGQAGAANRGNKPGFDVANAGDVNGDGFPDLLMAAALYDAGQTDEGAVFVYHGGPNGTPFPIINSFSASQGATNSEFILMWTTTNSSSVSIDNGIGAVAVNGTITVTPAVTTTYTVTATGAGGTVTSSVTVTVNAPPSAVPVIDSFSATPTTITAGDSTVLSWTTTGADNVSIDNGVGAVAVDGTITVTPVVTTTYTVTAIGAGGTVISSVIVTVNAPPPAAPVIDSFSAAPIMITVGESTVLSWTTTGADNVSIDNGVGAAAVDGTVTVIPAVTTTYTITATGPGGSTSSVVTVTVDSGSAPQAVVSITGPTSINRGDQVSYTVTLTNTGTTTLNNAQLTFVVSPANRIKDLSPGNIQNLGNVPSAGSVSRTWTGRADKAGGAAIAIEALNGGVSIDTATLLITIIK